MSIPEYLGSGYSANPTAISKQYFRDIVINSSGTKLYATSDSSIHSIGFNDDPIVSDSFRMTIAGAADNIGLQNGNGVNAAFDFPVGVVMDTSGNVFVADKTNHNIRKIDTLGNVTTFAGDVSGNFGSTDSSGTFAKFNGPSYLAIDASNNIYVTDVNNYKIRKITNLGNVTTVAGSGTSGSDNGQGVLAKFTSSINGITCDSAGNLYVCEGPKIRKIDSSGLVTTYLESSGAQYKNIITDITGNMLYVSDAGRSVIEQIDSFGSVSLLAGSYNNRVTPNDFADISNLISDMDVFAGFDQPGAMAKDPSGNLYILDRNNLSNSIAPFTTTLRKLELVREVPSTITNFQGTVNGTMMTLTWGGGKYSRNYVFTFNTVPRTPVYYDWQLKTARFSGLQENTAYNIGIRAENGIGLTEAVYQDLATPVISQFLVSTMAATIPPEFDPESIAIDSLGNIYSYCDDGNNTIIKITPQGVISTFSNSGHSDLVLDSSNRLFSFYSNAIWKYDSSGNRSPFAGSESDQSYLDSSGTLARFNGISCMTIDSSDNLYVYDGNNYRIRKITPTGNVTTLAGSGIQGSDDGSANTATFDDVSDMTCDLSGNIYIIRYDAGTYKIRKITSSGTVTTVMTSILYDYNNIVCDKQGNIYVSGNSVDRNYFSNIILKIGPGTEELISGSTDVRFIIDGMDLLARYDRIMSPIVDNSGNIIILEYQYQQPYLRKLTRNTNSPSPITNITWAKRGSSIDINWSGGEFSREYTVSISDIRGAKLSSTDPVFKNASFIDLTVGNTYTIDITGTNYYNETTASITFVYADSQYLVSTLATASLSTGIFDIIYDSSGNMYVNDNSTYIISKISPQGAISTFHNYSSISNLDELTPMAIDSSNNIYVGDYANYVIYKIDTSGNRTIFAGDGTEGNIDSVGTLARFTNIRRITIDPLNNLYVADGLKIRKISPYGAVTFFCGSDEGAGDDTDNGEGSNARFKNIISITCDARGYIYVSENLGGLSGIPMSRIRRIDQTRKVATLTTSNIYMYSNIISSKQGAIYAVCRFNFITSFIMKIFDDPGIETIFSGSYSDHLMESIDNMDILARYTGISGIAIDKNGNMAVIDIGSTRSYIRQLTMNSSVPQAITNITWSAINGQAIRVSWQGGNYAREYSFTLEPACVLENYDPVSKTATFAGLEKTTYTITITATNIAGSTVGTRSIDFTSDYKFYAHTPSYYNYTIDDTVEGLLEQKGSTYIDSSGILYSVASAGTEISKVNKFSFNNSNNTYEITTYDTAEPGGYIAITKINHNINGGGTLLVYLDDNIDFPIFNIIRGTVSGPDPPSSFSSGFNDGPLNLAKFSRPRGIAADLSGNIYIADSDNFRIRKIYQSSDFAYTVTTLAGNEIEGDGNTNDDGQGTAAKFTSSITEITCDPYGNVYVCEGRRIRKIDQNANVTTFITVGVVGDLVKKITADNRGHVYAIVGYDPNDTLVDIDPNGNLTIMAEVASSSEQWRNLTSDNSGNLYIIANGESSSDSSFNRVLKFSPEVYTVGIVSTLSLSPSFPVFRLNGIDSLGNLYASDDDTQALKKIRPNGDISVFYDGNAFVNQVVYDSSNNLFEAHDTAIYKYDVSGNKTLFAGSDTVSGFLDSSGTLARFDGIYNMTIDSFNNLYVIDLNNFRIRRITPSGNVTTIIGSGVQGNGNDEDNGNGINAKIMGYNTNNQYNIICDSSGNIYFIESGQIGSIFISRIRKIDSSLNVTTIANKNPSGPMDLFYNGLVYDKKGNLYVVVGNFNASNTRIINRINLTTLSETLFSGDISYTGSNIDGTTILARYSFINNMIINNDGSIIYLNSGYDSIRKITL